MVVRAMRRRRGSCRGGAHLVLDLDGHVVAARLTALFLVAVGELVVLGVAHLVARGADVATCASSKTRGQDASREITKTRESDSASTAGA